MHFFGPQRTSEYIASQINASANDRVLDIGCGTSTILRYLPQVYYLGIDSNPKYILKARNFFGESGDFQCKSVDDFNIESTQKFDRILLIGVLHHLTDEQILSLMLKIKDLLSVEGQLITYDGVLLPKQNPIARLLLKIDRGRHVRTVEAYLSLISTTLTVTSSQTKNDFLRIPYSVLFTISSIDL
ncbi:MAG: class I SAM-dependent methyltransferase [Gammaproteobacteria bacterium]